MIDVAKAISSLPFEAVPQSENAILNQLLAELQGLREEVATLREENQDLKEKVVALESTELQDIDRICVDIAQDRQRITKLEKPPEQKNKPYSPKVAAHLDDIYGALQERERSCKGAARKWDFISFWEAAELLDLSHRRISQLADIARNDPRFIISWHPKKKNTKVFKINSINLGNLASIAHETFRAKDGLLGVC